MSTLEVVVLGHSDHWPAVPSADRLASVGLAATFVRGHPSGDASATLAVATGPISKGEVDKLLALTHSGVPVLFAWSGEPVLHASIEERAGVSAGDLSQSHEVRVRSSAAFGDRVPPDFTLQARVRRARTVEDDVSILAAANLALVDHPVLTYRESTGVGIVGLGAEPSVWDSPSFLQLLHRWVHQTTRRIAPPTVTVGLLGYGAIGHEHNRAVQAVPGLSLAAVCDRDPARVAVARQLSPDVVPYVDAQAMLESPGVDLVVVSTPPDSHAEWALRALDAGKHVVLEKPMALSTKECDAVLVRAREVNRTAVVYQNRRWDPDFLALQRLVDGGVLGGVFHLEAFVGQYGHPCNYWHSDAGVSGGAIFDWGSHFLDQLLLLNRSEVVAVTAAEHKRVWLDVTNADHARVTLHFADGAEASFIHSDVAAASKPKWYVLGTQGAVVANWRYERIVSRTDIGTVAEERFAAADAPADVALHSPDGSVTSVALPASPPQPFHRELADLLLDGIPMSVDPEQSRHVVSVMEAAAESALSGGRQVRPA